MEWLVSQYKPLVEAGQCAHLEFYGGSLLSTQKGVCLPFQHNSVKSLNISVKLGSQVARQGNCLEDLIINFIFLDKWTLLLTSD